MRKKHLKHKEWIKWFELKELGKLEWKRFFIQTGWNLPMSKSQISQAQQRFKYKYWRFLKEGHNIFMKSKKRSPGRPSKLTIDQQRELFNERIKKVERKHLEEIARRYFEITKDKIKSSAIDEYSKLEFSSVLVEQLFSVCRQSIYKYQNGIIKDCKRTRKSKYHTYHDLIKKEFNKSKFIYGRLKISKKLESININISPRTVGNIMNKLNLHSKVRIPKRNREFKIHDDKFVDLVNRDFNPVDDNIISTDIKYIGCKEHSGRFPWAYLSVAISHKTKAIESYKISKTNDVNLVYETLKNIKPRNELIVHSDRGFQYSSEVMKELSKTKNYKISMKSTRDPLDNREVEYFFSILEVELLQRHSMNALSFNQVSKLINKYINWYNTRRIQSRINWKVPAEASTYINC